MCMIKQWPALFRAAVTGDRGRSAHGVTFTRSGSCSPSNPSFLHEISETHNSLLSHPNFFGAKSPTSIPAHIKFPWPLGTF